MVVKRKEGSAGLTVKHSEFGVRLDGWMRLHHVSNRSLALELGKKEEMVRRYRKGIAKPKDRDTIEKLATLMNMAPDELEWGKRPLPGVAKVPIIEVTVDEQALIDIYRQLSDVGRKLVRARAAELFERFGQASPENPFGKGKRATKGTN